MTDRRPCAVRAQGQERSSKNEHKSAATKLQVGQYPAALGGGYKGAAVLEGYSKYVAELPQLNRSPDPYFYQVNNPPRGEKKGAPTGKIRVG